MIAITNVRDRIVDVHPFVLVGCGALLFALVNISITYFLIVAFVPFIENYGMSLQYWMLIIGPSLTITGMYPTIGASIVRSGYDQLFSRWGILLQAAVGPFLTIILWILSHSLISYMYQLLFVGKIRQSYAHVIFMFTAYPATFVGVWSGLVFYWLWNRVRPEYQQTTG